MKKLDPTQKAVCDLLSSVVFGNPLTLPDETEWKAVYEELSAHAVLGIFRDAMPQWKLPRDVREDWGEQIDYTIIRGIQIGAGQRELVQLLDENGIAYAIIKGTATAQYYPIELSRSLGDVDFIVQEADYDRTQQLLEANGYRRAHKYEDNPRHESFNKDGIHYECHHAFAERSFPHAAKIDGFIANGIAKSVSVTTEYGSFRSLPTAINGLVLLEHIAIHIKAGLGLRQILDWLLYAQKHLSDADWAGENGSVIRETGLDTLAKAVTKAGQIYFGLNPAITWCADAPEEVCEELVQLVFSYGNFGNKTTVDDKVVSVARRYRRGILKNLQYAGEHNWKILHKYPRLKPFASLYQLGRYSSQVLSRKGALKALFTNKKNVDSRERLMLELGI